MSAEQVIFYILSGAILVFSFLTVTSRRILRATVFLLFVLSATAGFYFMFEYFFLAAVQLIVYVGGIVVLIIFSILLTSQINDKLEMAAPMKSIVAGLTSVLGAGVCIYLILGHGFTPFNSSSQVYDVGKIGEKLLSYGDGGYVLPFEVISILLLAAMIAAIVIAKREKNPSEN